MSRGCMFIESLSDAQFHIYETVLIFDDSFFRPFLLDKRFPNPQEINRIENILVSKLAFPEEFLTEHSDTISISRQIVDRLNKVSA